MPKAFHPKSGLLTLVAAGLLVASCTNNGSKHRNPGRIYAPDMTYSRAYDYYSENPVFADKHSARVAVAGTLSRGHELPDHLNLADTALARTFTTNMKFSESEIEHGKRLYNIQCAICHGTNLDGNGPLYNGGNGKFAAAPANLKGPNYLTMPAGQIYYAIKFGKNAMGSYASQLDVKERWQVVAYIKKVQSENGGAAFTMGTAPITARPASGADSTGELAAGTTPAGTPGTEGADGTPASTSKTTASPTNTPR